MNYKVMWTTDLILLINQKPTLKKILKWINAHSLPGFMNTNWTALCKHTDNYRFLLHNLYRIQNHNIKHIWFQKQNLSPRLSSGYVLVFAFQGTCFRLSHQLPCFALEVLGCHQWRWCFFWFTSQCVCVFLPPAQTHSIISQSVKPSTCIWIAVVLLHIIA